MKRTYCYSMRNAVTGAKMVGGMLHASSLEEANSLIPKYCKVELKVTGTKCNPRYRWMKDGKEVYLYLSIHADNNLNEQARKDYDALPFG